MRSLRCGGDGPLKTRAEGGDCLLFTRQHATFDQHCQTRMWIDAAQGLSGESTRLNNVFIGVHPRVDHGTQPGIGRFHPAKLYLFKQLGERVGLRDGRNGML